jgi:hypothetical protein
MNPENPVQDVTDEAGPQNRDRARQAAGAYADPWAEAMKDSARRFLDDPRRKSPALATIMSAMPGLGQVYVGYYQQGFTNILVVAGIITMLAEGNRFGMSGLEPLLGVFLAFFWLYNLVDAGRRASYYNQALAGLDRMALPEDLKLPGGGGALVGGVVLLVIGLIFFSNTMFGWSLEWLERWWPAGLIAGGAYLVYSGVKDKLGRSGQPS